VVLLGVIGGAFGGYIHRKKRRRKKTFLFLLWWSIINFTTIRERLEKCPT
jgi:hypothetical protein